MSTVHHRTTATPDEVWRVLADGWSYAGWVVGASRIRAVADDWPAVGSVIHHSVGQWPVLLDDETTVLECEPGTRLVLQAKARPYGQALVEIEVHAHGSRTLIEMREDAVRGPGLLIPAPARQLAIVPRNNETLLRLALLAERRASP